LCNADPGESVTCDAAPPAPAAKATVADAGEIKVDDGPPVDVHPRKRKLRPREADPSPDAAVAAATAAAAAAAAAEPQEAATPAPLPVTNCYEMYFSIRKQIERRHRNLLPVQPKPPQGFKDYLMNRCTYVIAGNAASRLSVPVVSPPPSLPPPMRDLFADQEKERYRLRMQVQRPNFKAFH